jgi:hypothetical protein
LYFQLIGAQDLTCDFLGNTTGVLSLSKKVIMYKYSFSKCQLSVFSHLCLPFFASKIVLSAVCGATAVLVFPWGYFPSLSFRPTAGIMILGRNVRREYHDTL